MSWFLNLTTRAKLIVSFGLMILVLLAVAATAYQGIKSIQESEKKLFEVEFANAVDLFTFEANLNRARADTLAMLLLTKRSEKETLKQDIFAYSKESDTLTDNLLERNRHDQEIQRRLKELKSQRETFKQVRDKEVLPLAMAGKTQEAQAFQSQQNERFAKMRTIVREVANGAERNAQTAVTQSGEKADQAVLIFVIVSVSAILLSVGLILFLNRIIATPLKDISAAARRIAEGDLKQEKLLARSTDEIGQLTVAFNGMLESLQELARQTNVVTASLNSAGAEIMASTQQQAASTREQAATVQEVTTTMEEVSQSGSQISTRAKQVAAAAEATSVVSNAGLQAVQETTRTMGAIREQVEEVAENIVAVSEKTQAVGEIIATVNDIAERSNLLALNATIEAAAAGEQGNRFSVVANEMKNLADQAKESTVQVRTILGDIQKGINSSVMLTEEAVKRAETGKQQADVTEQTIRQMAKSTLDSVQAFEQIIGAGNQQQIGFEQVAQGMKDIRQAAGQTAAATSQLEKAVANLNALGQELKKTVGRYKL